MTRIYWHTGRGISVVQTEVPSAHSEEPQPVHRVAVLDGMANVQSIGKLKGVKTCSDFTDLFLQSMDLKVQDYEVVHLVFDMYDVPNSRKNARGERRTVSKTPVAYHTGTTSIGNQKMS